MLQAAAAVKLEFHGSILPVASSWHPRRHADILARMSQGCYEKTAFVELMFY